MNLPIFFHKTPIRICAQTLFFAVMVLLLSSYSQQNIPPRTPRDRLIDDIMSDISDLKQTTHCYQVEKEILEEKLNQQEAMIESLQKQLKNFRMPTDELSNGKIALLEKKISSLEKINEGLVSDLRQFKTHANEAAASLQKFQSKISSLEQEVDNNLGHMKKALESLMILSKKGKDAVSPSEISQNGTYRVKAGDTLERIARAHGVTIEAIKKSNQLTSDRIIIGQELHIEQ